MSQYIISTEVIILYISVVVIPTPDLVQSLAPVGKIADFFVPFLTGPFARSIAIVGWGVWGFIATADRLPGGACLVLTGSRLSFGGPVLPEIPYLLRRRV